MNIPKREVPKPDYEKRVRLAQQAVAKAAHPGKNIDDIINELVEENEPDIFEKVGLRFRDVIKEAKKRKKTFIILYRIFKLIWHLKSTGQIKDGLLRKIIKGDSTAGKIFFGVLDVAPVPNLHEITKSVWKKHPELPFHEKIKLVLKKIDWTRTAVAILTTLAAAGTTLL